METLGKFAIVRKIGNCSKNSLLFEVTPVKERGANSILRATLHRLQPPMINRIKKGQLSHVLPLGRERISEIFFIAKNSKKYMVVITDPEEGLTGTEELQKISYKKCLEIFTEAVFLLQEIHWLGFRLGQSLKKYVQIGGNQQQAPKISMLKVTRGSWSSNSRNMFFGRGEESTINFSYHQVEYLRHLLNYLLERTPLEKIVPNKLNELANILHEVPEGEQLFDQRMARIIFQTNYLQEKIRLSWEWNLIKQKRTLNIEAEGQSTYFRKKQTFVADLNRSISTPELYFHLSTQSPGEIRVKERAKIQFSDSETDRQITLNLAPSFGKGKQGDQRRIEYKLGNQSINYNEYPFDCVIKVISVFQRDKERFKVKGVGILISPNIVVTCAHVVYSTLERRSQGRRRASRVEVIIGQETVQVDKYKFPDEFNNPRSQRANDFAVLHLSHGIKKDRFLKIAKNYRTNSQISLVKIEQGVEATLIKVTTEAEPAVIDNGQIFKHYFETMCGDSGSPIIVQFAEQPSQFYLIAIHSAEQKVSDMFSRRLSVKMTSAAIQKIMCFAQQLGSSKAYLRLGTVEYEEIIDSIGQLKRQERVHLQKLQQNSRINYLRYISGKVRSHRIELQDGRSIKLHQIEKMRNQLYHKYNQYISLFSSKQEVDLEARKALQQELVAELSEFKLKWVDRIPHYLQPDPRIIENWLFLVASESSKLEDFWEERINDLHQFIAREKTSQLFHQIHFEWEKFAIFYKYAFWKERYVNESLFQEALYYVMNPKNMAVFHTFRDMVKQSIKKEQLFQLSLNEKEFEPFHQIHPSSLRLRFPEAGISPFSSFKVNGVYKLGNLLFNEYEYEVQMQDETQLLEYTWQHIDFVHTEYPFLYPSRVIDRPSGTYALKLKFRSSLTLTLLDYMQVIKSSLRSPLLDFELLGMMMNICHVIADLHSKKQYLCAPIQFCLLINNSQRRISFFHLGHPPSFYSHIRRGIPTLSPQQIMHLCSYYPVKEILESEGNRAAFERIDACMLSSSLDRIMRETNFFNYNERDLRSGNMFKLWLSLMRLPAKGRMTVEQLGNQLNKFGDYIKRVRNKVP